MALPPASSGLRSAAVFVRINVRTSSPEEGFGLGSGRRSEESWERPFPPEVKIVGGPGRTKVLISALISHVFTSL